MDQYTVFSCCQKYIGGFMNRQRLDGVCYADMLKGGIAMLAQHAAEIDDLNVFPVPDGDTGTNMAKTMDGGISAIGDESSISGVSVAFTRGALLGARGNSGVILSQIFAGINEELSHHDEVGVAELLEAYKSGIKKSYSAVQNPTEGTILTVFRESVEYLAEKIGEITSIEDFYRLHIEMAKDSLARTKEILPALAEADVVDSGGAGYLYIVLGMYAVLTGEIDGSIYKSAPESKEAKIDIDRFTRDSKLEFGYCTEFLLRLTTDRVDPDSFDISRVTEVLDALGGESVVAYKNDDVVKVHVHTFNPGAILSRMQEFGEFLTVKIENMSLGHSGEQKKKSKKPYSVIAVASGDGLEALFTELGADRIVTGGQTSNPSAEEFIEAFRDSASEEIIVLPNNKNVFLAAKQASELYSDAKIHIIPTENLMEGYSALSVITPGLNDVSAIVESATHAISGVVGAEITRAVRDTTVCGKEIKKNDYISVSDKDILAVTETPEAAVIETLGSLDMDDYEIITLFVGKQVSEEKRAELTELIEERYEDHVLDVYVSGHEIYDYMISVE